MLKSIKRFKKILAIAMTLVLVLMYAGINTSAADTNIAPLGTASTSY